MKDIREWKEEVEKLQAKNGALEIVTETAWGKTLNSLHYGLNIVQHMKQL